MSQNNQKVELKKTNRLFNNQKTRETNINISNNALNCHKTVCSVVSSNMKSSSNAVSGVSDFHDRLCEWGNRLNSMFSIQILFTTGLTSVVVIVCLYIFYLMISNNEKYKLTFEDASNLIIRALWVFSTVLGTSYACAKTKNEVFLNLFDGVRNLSFIFFMCYPIESLLNKFVT